MSGCPAGADVQDERMLVAHGWLERGRLPSTMARVQLTLPDERAQRAVAAGLLSAEAIQEMLQERLQRRAGESFREIHSRSREGRSADAAPAARLPGNGVRIRLIESCDC